MSRFYDGDGAEYMNADYLWAWNVKQALKGKRGRKALAELREALLALPEKRLISDALCTVNVDASPVEAPPRWEPGMSGEEFRAMSEKERAWELRQLLEEQGRGVCAVGAYAWWKKVKAGADPLAAFEELPVLESAQHDMWETAKLGQDAGLSGVLAWEFAYANDERFGAATPEERYVKFLGWVDAELAAA